MIRTIQRVEVAVMRREGNGFEVRRVLPLAALPQVDPFLLLEEIGQVNLAAADPRAAPEHPLRGVELVTWMLAGNLQSVWPDGIRLLGPGDAEWVTAGAGSLHRETYQAGVTWSLRIWVSLPLADRRAPLQVQQLAAASVPTDRTAGGIAAQVLAGTVLGARPGLQPRTRTTVARLQLPADSTLVQTVSPIEPGRPVPAVLLYVLAGQGMVGPAAGERLLRLHELAVLNPPPAPAVPADANRDEIRLRTRPAETLDVLLLVGFPVGEAVVRRGPFALRTEEEILQGVEDFRTGRFGTLPP